jgi:hypothetical protein
MARRVDAPRDNLFPPIVESFLYNDLLFSRLATAGRWRFFDISWFRLFPELSAIFYPTSVAFIRTALLILLKEKLRLKTLNNAERNTI